MRSLPLALVLLPLLSIYQTMPSIKIQLAGGSANLVLVTVLAWNIISRNSDGLLWAFIGGLSLDVLSGGPMGSTVLSMLLVSIMAGLVSGRLWGTHWLLSLIWVAVGTVIYHGIYLLVLTICGWHMVWQDSFMVITLPSSVLNLALMIPVYPIVRSVASRIVTPRVSI